MKFLAKVFGKIGAGLSALRRYVAHILTVIVIIFVVSAIFAPDETPEVPESGFLVLAPMGVLVEEQASIDPTDAVLNRILGGGEVAQENVYELVTLLEQAKNDDRITGMYLNMRRFAGGSLNHLQLLADAIADFRSSGKKVYTAADNYTQTQYLLASQADEIWVHPLGGIMLEGLRTERAYYRELLDKLKVKINVFRVGSYKSAVEPYLLNGMSDEARENLEGWLNEQWQQYLTTVVRHRDIDPRMTSGKLEDLLAALEESNYDMAQMAQENGLVDELLHRHEVLDRLIDLAGGDKEKGEFEHINHRNYWQTLPESVRNRNADGMMSNNRVAIILAKGVIVDGQGMPTEIGGDRLASELRKARYDDKVKAVVLRVDSPGGSAFASEVIRQELLQLREAGKPVIASMSSVAASGGYWISAGADQIIAEPSTITGSIGVFGLIPTVDETLAEIGVFYDGASTTEIPGFSMTQPITEELGLVVQSGVDAIYEDFLDLVAAARGMTREAVHNVAQGQVWSGERALQLGLVDELGNLELAVQRAAEKAELESYAAFWPEREKTFMEQLLEQLGVVKADVEGLDIAELRQLLNPRMVLKQFNDPRAIYLRCFECE
ncbi:signal peptide peptidase SppA [Aliidiomarina celeris]|uniref:signal peptide peptidase SppA n=1 Tax=Aliidiomarina celeris TaxID=2249428 RepID=UPI000DE9408B|nr:signal peptide peptidase SppA [Aliidiomarina celeris]